MSAREIFFAADHFFGKIMLHKNYKVVQLKQVTPVSTCYEWDRRNRLVYSIVNRNTACRVATSEW